MARNRQRLLAAVALALLVSLFSMKLAPTGVAQALPAPKEPGTIEAHTAPSQRAAMHFRDGGIIKSVAVKEGQVVKLQDLLMAQDDEIDQAELDRLTLEATSDFRVQYYQASLDVATQKLKRMEDAIAKARATGGGVMAFADAELEQARAEKTQAERQMDVSGLDHKGDINKARQQELKVAKMKLYAPFDGVVESVGTWPGELATPDKDKPSIVLVKNDPCYVVVTTLTTSQVSQLKLGDVFEVKYPEENTWRQAKVAYIAPVAEIKGNAQLVRLELANPELRNTGLPILVKLPAKLAPVAGVSSSR